MDFKDLDYDQIQKDLTEFVQERPLEGVLLSFGAGLGLAVLASTKVLPGILKTVTIASIPKGIEWFKTAVMEAGKEQPSIAPSASVKSDSLVH